MADNKIPETVVTDKRVALEGAYAEKPFRDAEIKYREQLPDKGRKALEMIAGKEGEEAMAAFLQTRSLEDPRIAALRELVSKTIILSRETKSIFGQGEGIETARLVENVLQQLSQGMLDRLIIDGKMNLKDKMERMRSLGSLMNAGVQRALFPPADWPSRVVEDCRASDSSVASGNDSIADFLRGYFAVKIMTNDPRSISALAEIGKLEGRKPAEVILEHMPLILTLRQEYPERVNKSIGVMTTGFYQVRALDQAMERCDFLWSPGTRTYVHISGLATSVA